MKRFVTTLLVGAFVGRLSVYLPLILEYLNTGEVASLEARLRKSIEKSNRDGRDIEAEFRETKAEWEELIEEIKRDAVALIKNKLR